jgi:hypothetical protein
MKACAYFVQILMMSSRGSRGVLNLGNKPMISRSCIRRITARGSAFATIRLGAKNSETSAWLRFMSCWRLRILSGIRAPVSPIPLSKGTAEIANREVPTNRRKSLGPENVLHFRDDQETCKFAGNTNGTGGSHLVSF